MAVVYVGVADVRVLYSLKAVCSLHFHAVLRTIWDDSTLWYIAAAGGSTRERLESEGNTFIDTISPVDEMVAHLQMYLQMSAVRSSRPRF